MNAHRAVFLAAAAAAAFGIVTAFGIATASPASAAGLAGCHVYPGILVGEPTTTQGCPHNVSIKCDPACDELQVLVKPLVEYAFDTAWYVIEKSCEPEPRLCE